MKKKLNIFKIPFSGINLIEASAGTGKTSAIALLYLRALLGLNNHKYIKKNISINNILVVTFTNAAKEELYIRIKKNIEELYLSCINKKSANPIFKTFLKKIKNINEAIDILEKAKKNINNACIYTIHGFCQDILQSNDYNFNNKKIIDNENQLYLQATQDFWRYYFYNLPKNIIHIVMKYYKHPEFLLKELKSIFCIDSVNFKKNINSNETILTLHEKNIKKIKLFKKKWLKNICIILKIINQLNINKKIYNQFNLLRWCNKITTWSNHETKNYHIPICLKYFLKNNIKKNIIENIQSNKNILNHTFFKDIEKFLKISFSLKNIILFHAINKIKEFVKKEKKRKLLLGFNDLLKILLKSIKKNNFLKKLIIKKYPIVFIDEFQDTDTIQYNIFNTLYNKKDKTALFLIGDPKQSIYSFRGADIFSYLYAKSKIKNYYYLNTNWRSAKNICNAINYLFSQKKNVFLLKNISFTPVLSSKINQKIYFRIKGIIQTAIHLFFLKKNEISQEEYTNWIAEQCAKQISYWLIYAKKGEATITKKNEEKILKASDIVILVRNKNEANIIKDALKKVNIKSTYSSLNKSVFQTFDAYELLCLLKTILEPTNIKLLKQSLSTHILSTILFKCSMYNIDKINNHILQQVIEKIFQYKTMWYQVGIFYTIKNMLLEYQKNANSFEMYKNHQKNINFLHIGELLEEKSKNFYQKTSLLRWFEKKILDKKTDQDNECIRYFQKSDTIKIVTIHKSKGLEYPIVWIPFIINYKFTKTPLYHDIKSFKIFFDINYNHESLKQADKERLSEDVRLLYVAITRAIYHISIGVGYVKKNKKESNYSNIPSSGLGYIIQNGKKNSYLDLINQLNLFNKTSLIEIKNNEIKTNINNITKKIYFLDHPEIIKKNIENNFQITSFTKIRKNFCFFSKNTNEYIKKYFNKKNYSKLTIHNFPQGKKTGLLIHYILKKINFSNVLNINFFKVVLEKYQLPQKWIYVLMNWIENIIKFPFNYINITLSSLKKQQYIKEFEFFLPIKNTLYSYELNKIIQSLDTISSISPKISFDPISGIFKGFIDLVFISNNKYYILDYKSNYLGNHEKYYSHENIIKDIIKNRYDLQYQLYTVAIHIYLEKKIKKYHYTTHFGGVFYLFLRGINNKKNIFYTCPNYSLIKKLTHFFDQ